MIYLKTQSLSNSCHPISLAEKQPAAEAALTRCPSIGKLGFAGPRQLEEREEVTGVPVPVQVGVQARLLAPRRVPRAVLEAQLVVNLAGAHGGTEWSDVGMAEGWRMPLPSHPRPPQLRSPGGAAGMCSAGSGAGRRRQPARCPSGCLT